MFQRSFMTIIKAQGLYNITDPDFEPDDGDQYDKQLFNEKSFVYSVLVSSLQTDKGRELVKEFEGDARTIICKLHHYHAESNVAQHEVVTLTTYITNLRHTENWKGTTCQFLILYKRNFICWIVLSLTLTTFQKQSGSSSSREHFRRTMT